jgi:hypothetical protein
MEPDHAKQDDSEYFSVHFSSHCDCHPIRNYKPCPNSRFLFKGTVCCPVTRVDRDCYCCWKTGICPGGGDIEHYGWEISYPGNLRQNFESLFLKDQDFKNFYAQNKSKKQSEIHDNSIAESDLNKFLDILFVIKKAAEFAGQTTAEGDLFIIREREKGSNRGKAVLTFPTETEPIAFAVTSGPERGGKWHIRFGQPKRYVEYEGRINVWPGADLEVDFEIERRGEWSGPLHYNGVYVGKFSVTRTRTV